MSVPALSNGLTRHLEVGGREVGDLARVRVREYVHGTSLRSTDIASSDADDDIPLAVSRHVSRPDDVSGSPSERNSARSVRQRLDSLVGKPIRLSTDPEDAPQPRFEPAALLRLLVDVVTSRYRPSARQPHRAGRTSGPSQG